MNRWYQIRRLRGGAFLILVGVLALLNGWHVLSWDKSWPLFLIVAGLLALAERAAWTADVREQQAAQGYGSATGPGTGTIPPGSAGTPYGFSAPQSTVEEKPFIQTHPPFPEDSGREDR